MSCNSFLNWKLVSKRLFDVLGNVCCGYVFPVRGYCLVLAWIGLVVTSADIYRVLSDGAVLSDRVWPMRRSTTKPVRIREETERDVRLITAVVEWTVYGCLLLGAHNSAAYFLLPWLWLRMLLLLSAVTLTIARLLHQRPVTVDSIGLVGGLLQIHNFLYVSCLFRNLLNHRI